MRAAAGHKLTAIGTGARKSIYDSPLSYFQNVHQIFLQIMETMKMIKIIKIIQTIKMKVTTQQINVCSKSTIEKKFWCLYGYLWTYFTPCSSVFNVDFKHVVVHYFLSITNIKDLCFTCIKNLHIFLPSFLKNFSFTLH